MTTFTIAVNRDYTSWKFHYADSHNEITCDDELTSSISPASCKLFSGDIFSIGSDNKPVMISSPIRDGQIPGVLILDSGRTFGRLGRRLLYKCIPDDRTLPSFLVPYQVQSSFSKAIKNKFIVFRFMEWTDVHPTGEIVETLGDVDELSVFYDYQVWRNKLHINVSDFSKKTSSSIHENGGEAAVINKILINPSFNIDDCRAIDNIFSIDPATSTDYDDAFSVIQANGITRVNIYIANVFVWLEMLGLWSVFAGRVSTIYLPDKKRPMLPSSLSDGSCSLKQGEVRFAFMMTVAFDLSGNIVEEPSFKNVAIRVQKNYAYEEPALKKSPSYRILLQLTKLIGANIGDSHDVVAFWMIYMNHHAANSLSCFGVGIFRGTVESLKSEKANKEIVFSDDVMRVINSWNKDNAGSYAAYSNTVSSHSGLGLTAYTHITSPIRRIVDLLNQMLFFKHSGLIDSFSEGAQLFLDKWIGSLEHVNTTVKQIRRVQMDCELLQRCSDIAKQFCGVIIDEHVSSLGMYEYTVYLEELKLISKVKSHTFLEKYSVAKFEMFLFEDEDKLYKKVRLQMVV